MDWTGISEFVLVAEQASFTKGAKIIGSSTAQVSRLISRLEKRLAIKLFYRTTRKVSLTEEGQLFYQKCRELLDGLDEAEDLIQDLQHQPKGHIKITAPVTYGEQCIIPLVNDYIKKYPQVNVQVYLTNRSVNLIEEGVDLAIRIGKLEDSSMMASKLTERKNYICATSEYFQHNEQPQNLDELKNHNCLLGSSDTWVLKNNGKSKSVKVSGNIKYNSGYGLTDAALKNLGIVYLPDFYVEPLINSKKLKSILEAHTIDESIWALYSNNRFLPLKTKKLIQFFKDNL